MSDAKTDSVAVLREMLPCPFCGEVPTIANIRADENQGTKWGGVVCSCGIVGPEVRTGYEPVAEWADRAAEAWNERTPSAALSAQGEAKVAAYIMDPGAGSACDRLIFPRDRERYEADVQYRGGSFTPLYLHPAPPGSDAVTEEMAADVLHRFNATAPSGDHWPPERCRELRIKAMQQAITNAALAARTGKGEANGR